jgi:hypothetical protein
MPPGKHQVLRKGVSYKLPPRILAMVDALAEQASTSNTRAIEIAIEQAYYRQFPDVLGLPVAESKS